MENIKAKNKAFEKDNDYNLINANGQFKQLLDFVKCLLAIKSHNSWNLATKFFEENLNSLLKSKTQLNHNFVYHKQFLRSLVLVNIKT